MEFVFHVVDCRELVDTDTVGKFAGADHCFVLGPSLFVVEMRTVAAAKEPESVHEWAKGAIEGE